MGNKKSCLAIKTLHDLKKHTDMSNKEIQNWYKGFIKDHPSGYVSTKELKQPFKLLYPSGDANEFVEYVLKELDQDHDGKIDVR